MRCSRAKQHAPCCVQHLTCEDGLAANDFDALQCAAEHSCGDVAGIFLADTMARYINHCQPLLSRTAQWSQHHTVQQILHLHASTTPAATSYPLHAVSPVQLEAAPCQNRIPEQSLGAKIQPGHSSQWSTHATSNSFKKFAKVWATTRVDAFTSRWLCCCQVTLVTRLEAAFHVGHPLPPRLSFQALLTLKRHMMS